MRNFLIAAAMIYAAAHGEAMAGDRCDAPVAQWQPREILKARLEASGWRVRSIRSRDGCYEADGTDGNGVEIHAVFDPKSLTRVDDKADGNAG